MKKYLSLNFKFNNKLSFSGFSVVFGVCFICLNVYAFYLLVIDTFHYILALW